MSFIDKILDKMSLNSEDDEEFDNEDYYLDDEEEEELPRNPFRRKKEAAEEEPAIKAQGVIQHQRRSLLRLHPRLHQYQNHPESRYHQTWKFA